MEQDVVSREVVEGWTREYESALRASYPDERLPEDWQRELAGIDRGSVLGALRYWGTLKAFTFARHREQYAPVNTAAAEAAMRQLLRREPMTVVLESGREVMVTSRSYAALAEIASHHARLRELIEATNAGPPADLLRRLLHETMLHRRAIWAHALTASGAPARHIDDAPSWWPEITPRDDVALLLALFDVGSGRYERLGESPSQAEPAKQGEDFGWGSLFSTIERAQKMAPAEMYDRDLYQQLAWLRAGAPPPIEMEG